MLPEGKDKLIDGQVRRGGRRRQPLPTRIPFGDDAGVVDPGCLGAVLAEQQVTATAKAVSEGDDRLTALFVAAVRGDRTGTAGHAVDPFCGRLPQKHKGSCRTSER